VRLHGFNDASQQAYGTCIYLRTITKSNVFDSPLVTSKTRVAPIKETTISRLELLGNTVLAELTTTKNILKKEIPIHQTIYWTDSKVTLAWIQSPKKEYKIFVENRLCSIRKQTEIPDWKFVGTNFNPADLITRFIKPASLIENEL